jgi:hypothetical protein
MAATMRPDPLFDLGLGRSPIAEEQRPGSRPVSGGSDPFLEDHLLSGILA